MATANDLLPASRSGPQTPEGKAAVRFNALKHGLQSREVVLPQENPADFEDLLSSFREYYQPVGAPEEHMVKEIAIATWRLDRCHRAEIGEIRQRRDTAKVLASAQRIEDFIRAKNFPSEGTSQKFFRQDSLGIKQIIGLLKSAQQEAEEQNQLSAQTAAILSRHFGDDFLRGLTLDRINRKLEQLHGAAKIWEEKERLEMEARLDSMLLPEPAAMNKILRYETSIKRQLRQDIGLLIALQSQRQGR